MCAVTVLLLRGKAKRILKKKTMRAYSLPTAVSTHKGSQNTVRPTHEGTGRLSAVRLFCGLILCATAVFAASRVANDDQLHQPAAARESTWYLDHRVARQLRRQVHREYPGPRLYVGKRRLWPRRARRAARRSRSYKSSHYCSTSSLRTRSRSQTYFEVSESRSAEPCTRPSGEPTQGLTPLS